uniref:Arrestin C-terminal-like domain-containing protein n=1 Tax=Panagrolaimus superbus TaxID=310955 RepID=A0A914YLZ2_9BILA
MPINVCKKYNVMENPSLLQSKTISNLSLSHKPKLTVPRSVAIIGQPISLLIELENSSYYAIKSIIVGIGMRIIYKGKSKDLHFKENEKTVSKVLWKKEVPFYVSQNNYGIIQQKVPTNNVETETINDSEIKINYCLFVKFFSKQKILCSELSLPITFAKSFLSVLNAPPPPYYVNTCNSDTDIENIDFNLSIHPPTYDDVLSS